MHKSNTVSILTSSSVSSHNYNNCPEIKDTNILLKSKPCTSSTVSNNCLIQPIYNNTLLQPKKYVNYLTPCSNKYLQVNEYLSEYDTPYEKQLVRKNLGIDGLAYWGKIQGYIEDQEDLRNYINEQIFTINEDIDIKGGIWTVNDISELNQIPENKLSVGMLAYITSLEVYFQYTNNKTWSKAAFNSSGIQMYTQSMYNELQDKPENYILIEDNLTTVQNENLDMVSSMLQAIRALQAEVAKLKNSFKYGINSYTETKTSMSSIMAEGQENANEPLWALEEEDLSEFIPGTVSMNSSHQLQGEVLVDNENELLTITNEAYFQDPSDGFNKQTDPKSIVFITTTGKNVELVLKANDKTINVNLRDLRFSTVDLYNILLVISKKTTKSLEDTTLDQISYGFR